MTVPNTGRWDGALEREFLTQSKVKGGRPDGPGELTWLKATQTQIWGMRVLAAIIVAVCAFAVSGCSRWWVRSSTQEGAYAPVPPSNSYDAAPGQPPPNSYDAAPRSRPDPYYPPPNYPR